MILNKDKLLTGDILLIHDRGFNPVSWAIRELTHSYWNHCALYIGDGFLVEAQGNVIKAPVEKYDKDRYEYKVVRVRDSVFKDKTEYEHASLIAVDRVNKEIGRGYDWLAVGYLGIIYLTKATLNKILPQNWNILNSRKKFFCSELICFSYYNTSSIVKNLFVGDKYPNVQCDTITPKDLGKSKHIFVVDGLSNL